MSTTYYFISIGIFLKSYGYLSFYSFTRYENANPEVYQFYLAFGATSQSRILPREYVVSLLVSLCEVAKLEDLTVEQDEISLVFFLWNFILYY